LRRCSQRAAVSTEPTELIYRNWRDGRRIAAYPVRNDLQNRKRFGAPFYGVHRADLQHILSGALDGVELHLGHRLTNLVDQGDTIRLEFANGRLIQADVVIGADGVRSVVRRFVTGIEDVVYSRTSAFQLQLKPSAPTRTCCITRSAVERMR
jgi:salicylate hydroxylase